MPNLVQHAPEQTESFDIASILTTLKSSHGLPFLHKICLELSRLIAADFTFIALLDRQKKLSQTLSLVSQGKVQDNFSYALLDTPCSDVSNNNVCIFTDSVARLFPNDLLLEQMGIEGYIGTPLLDNQEQVMGLLVALYQRPIANAAAVRDLFALFSGRIAAELQRMLQQDALEDLNRTLEDKVSQRTDELTNTLKRLQDSQHRVFEQEKQASLGRLVSGVAHEVNTPLGTAVLAASALDDLLAQLEHQLGAKTLTRHQLQTGLQQLRQYSQSLNVNLDRSATLISSFKQLAAQQYADEQCEFSVAPWLHQLQLVWQPMLQQANVTLICAPLATDFCLFSFPARLVQVLTHLISNCCVHAFGPEHQHERLVRLHFQPMAPALRIELSDNGIGMSDQVLDQALEPFFTTKRGQGGPGLGLSIVNNLVVAGLNGKLELKSDLMNGTCVSIYLPNVVPL